MNEQTDYKPGDLVSLRSGSPVMTVSTVGADDVICEWWNDAENKFEWRKFRPVVLDLKRNE